MIAEVIDGTPFRLNQRTHYLRYDSALDHATVALECTMKYRSEMRADLANVDFVGRSFRTYEEVRQAVGAPWPEGIAVVERMIADLGTDALPPPKTARRRGCWDEMTGEEVSVDRWRSGDDYWWAIKPTIVHGPKVITMLVQIGANCNVASMDILWRGALAIVLAQLVEAAGYRAEIVAFAASTGTYRDGSGLIYTTPVKGPQDHIDITGLANLVSGWYFRTIGFAAMAATGVATEASLGRAIEATAPMADFLANGGRPWLVARVYNRQAAIACGRQLLASLGASDASK